jgi:hypothetical protein
MKLNKIVCLALVIAFVAGIGLAIAAEDSIMGTVMKTDAGLVLKTAEGNLIISGEDLSDMVGKTVKATGTITEGVKGKTITVISAEEVEK